MYACGPTVYDYAHIGNFRSYVNADIVRRTLEYLGYEVRHVMNITDVGHLTEGEIKDKIAEAAKSAGKSPEAIARFFEKDFFENIEKLRIRRPTIVSRATEHITEMILLIQALIKKGYAYEREGNVFFNVRKVKTYGKLSGNQLKNLKLGARLEPHPLKKHPADFALWLKAPKGHLMRWPSPWGEGYPGWHIECSAMSMKYLGPSFDLHLGGEDHIFPHHEAEIAQSRSATGKTFAHYWLHTRFLVVDGKKMSKSLGNIYTLRDLEVRGFDPLTFRLLALTSHYRTRMNFTWESLEHAKASLEKLREFRERLSRRKAKKPSVLPPSPHVQKIIKTAAAKFRRALENDFHTPNALAALFGMARGINALIDAQKLSPNDAVAVEAALEDMDRVLAVLPAPRTTTIPKDIQALVKKREEERGAEHWTAADKIRKEIEAKGWKIEDTPQGPLVFSR